jgi:hypothetical protein
VGDFVPIFGEVPSFSVKKTNAYKTISDLILRKLTISILAAM